MRILMKDSLLDVQDQEEIEQQLFEEQVPVLEEETVVCLPSFFVIHRFLVLPSLWAIGSLMILLK